MSIFGDEIMYYILDENRKPKNVSFEEYSDWNFSNVSDSSRIHKRKIVDTIFYNGDNISTIFLTVNHNFDDPEGKDPILYETMIFSDITIGGLDSLNNEYIRARTEEEAIKNHIELTQLYVNKLLNAKDRIIEVDDDDRFYNGKQIMSSTLMYRPVLPNAMYMLPNEIKKVISRRLWDTDGSTGGGEAVMTISDLEYLNGLKDAGIDGAETLIEAIKKYGAVVLWHEH